MEDLNETAQPNNPDEITQSMAPWIYDDEVEQTRIEVYPLAAGTSTPTGRRIFMPPSTSVNVATLAEALEAVMKMRTEFLQSMSTTRSLVEAISENTLERDEMLNTLDSATASVLQETYVVLIEEHTGSSATLDETDLENTRQYLSNAGVTLTPEQAIKRVEALPGRFTVLMATLYSPEDEIKLAWPARRNAAEKALTPDQLETLDNYYERVVALIYQYHKELELDSTPDKIEYYEQLLQGCADNIASNRGFVLGAGERGEPEVDLIYWRLPNDTAND